MPESRPSATVSIDAPIETVWAVMMDLDAYAVWNSFVRRVDCPSPPSPGDPIVLHVRWADGSTARSSEQVTVVEPPHDEGGVMVATLAYAYRGLPARLGLVRSVRHQRLSQVAGGPTAYDTVGEFSGPLVRLAGPARISDGFRRHAEGLKARAEALAVPSD